MKEYLRIFLVALGSFLLAMAAPAQPTLLRDLDTTATGGDSAPGLFTPFAGGALFWANSALPGIQEPWRTDGTASGTEPAATCPPWCGTPSRTPFSSPSTGLVFFAPRPSDPGFLAVTDGNPGGTREIFGGPGVDLRWDSFVEIPSRRLVFFVTVTAWAGPELWATDGTRAGTRQIQQIVLGDSPSVLVLGDQAFYVADAGQGPALWRSDGTRPGTVLVKDLVTRSANHRAPRLLGVGGGRLLFAGWTPAAGEEPWLSDGTSTGTFQLADLAVGRADSSVAAAATAGDRLYFVATAGSAGQELFTVEGRRARQLSRFADRRALVDPARLKHFGGTLGLGGKLLFTAIESGRGEEPWVSDGTPGGTVLLADACPGACSSQLGSLSARRVLGRVIFVASHPSFGSEPWITDGTPAGTHLLRDLCRGTCSSHPVVLGDAGSRALLVALGADERQRLWASDGTAAGTVRFATASSRGNFITEAKDLGDTVLLALDDGTTGSEVHAWRGGLVTELVADLLPGAGDSNACQYASDGTRAFFFADSGVGARDLWVTAGTPESTHVLLASPSGTEPGRPFFANLGAVRLGSRTLLAIEAPADPAFHGLWSTDGVALERLPGLGVPVVLGGLAYFAGVTDGALHRTDGTLAGTVRIADAPGPKLGGLAVGTRAFYSVGSAFDHELWVTDGTASGSRRIEKLAFGLADRGAFTALGPYVYFTKAGNSTALYRTDGTAEGTVLVTPESLPFNATTALTAFGGRLFLDGVTQCGHLGCLTVDPGSFVFDPADSSLTAVPGPSLRATTVLGDELYFFDESSRLWHSDGTPAGTAPVLATAGPSPPRQGPFYLAGDHLFLYDVQSGLWRIDGGSGEPSLVLGERLACPLATVVNGALLFTRATRETGAEPWLFP